jgi:hypothetical protein
MKPNAKLWAIARLPLCCGANTADPGSARRIRRQSQNELNYLHRGTIMKSLIAAMFLSVLAFSFTSAVRGADDKTDDKAADKAAAVIDKAIEAMGGADKLEPVKAGTWTSRGKILVNANENQFTSHVTVCGLNQFRQEFEGEFDGNKIKGITVLDKDKGWRKFGDEVHEMDMEAVANERRNLFLQIAALDPLVLKADSLKVEPVAEEKINDKPAAGLKFTDADGKDFTMYFDKETGLVVRQVAKVVGWDGKEFDQEVNYADYKEFGGIKEATKIEIKRDGEKFITHEISDFKPLPEKVEEEKFAEPK